MLFMLESGLEEKVVVNGYSLDFKKIYVRYSLVLWRVIFV